MRRFRTFRFAVLFVLLAATTPLSAQSPEGELPAEAKRRLEGIIGTWNSTWSWVNPAGEVVRSAKGVESATWAIEGRVVLMTTEIPSLDSHSKSLMFYSIPEQRMMLVSVDKNGDLWKLSGGLDDHVITSEPKKRGEREITIRFTHDETDHDHFKAVMETSIDGGKSWRVAVHQELVRRKDPPSDSSP